LLLVHSGQAVLGFRGQLLAVQVLVKEGGFEPQANFICNLADDFWTLRAFENQ
jgi:hypothetical protein